MARPGVHPFTPSLLGVKPPFVLGTRGLMRFKAGGFPTYRAVTSEQDPPSLPGAPPVHTRSFALAVRRNSSKLALRGVTRLCSTLDYDAKPGWSAKTPLLGAFGVKRQ